MVRASEDDQSDLTGTRNRPSPQSSALAHDACRCGHCKALAPQFQKVAENLQVGLPAKRVLCYASSTEANKQNFAT